MGRKKIFTDKVVFPLEMERELHSLIKKMARMSGKSMKEYITENILLEIQGHCVFCSQCNSPVLDSRTIHVDGTLTLTCPDCGHEWEYRES